MAKKRRIMLRRHQRGAAKAGISTGALPAATPLLAKGERKTPMGESVYLRVPLLTRRGNL